MSIAAVIIAFTAIGCGGKNQSDAAAKAEFVKKADALCKEAEKALQVGIQEELAGHEPRNAAAAKQAEAQIGKKVLIPAKRREAGELQALGSPSGDEDRVAAIVQATREGLRKAEAHPERAVKDGTEAFGKANRLKQEYGLSC